MRDKDGSWGLNGKRDYLFSALTRAQKHVTLITVDPPREIHSIEDTLNITGKGKITTETMEDSIIETGNVRECCNEDEKTRVQDLDDTIKKLTLRNVWQIKDDTVLQLLQIQLKTKGASMNWTRQGETLIITITKLSFTVATITSSPSNFKVTGL